MIRGRLPLTLLILALLLVDPTGRFHGRPAPARAIEIDPLSDRSGDLLEETLALVDAGRLLDARDRLRDLARLLDPELKLTTASARSALEAAQGKVYEIAWLYDNRLLPSRVEFHAMAATLFAALGTHFRERARDFRRHGYHEEGERFDRLARLADEEGAPWGEPVAEPGADRKLLGGFSALTRNLAHSVSKGFTEFSASVDRTLDLSESIKKREERRKEVERRR